jgi:hypothetical protein
MDDVSEQIARHGFLLVKWCVHVTKRRFWPEQIASLFS